MQKKPGFCGIGLPCGGQHIGPTAGVRPSQPASPCLTRSVGKEASEVKVVDLLVGRAVGALTRSRPDRCCDVVDVHAARAAWAVPEHDEIVPR
jgi:hypothetical protein